MSGTDFARSGWSAGKLPRIFLDGLRRLGQHRAMGRPLRTQAGGLVYQALNHAHCCPLLFTDAGDLPAFGRTQAEAQAEHPRLGNVAPEGPGLSGLKSNPQKQSWHSGAFISLGVGVKCNETKREPTVRVAILWRDRCGRMALPDKEGQPSRGGGRASPVPLAVRM